MPSPRRPAGELPADPDHIVLKYSRAWPLLRHSDPDGWTIAVEATAIITAPLAISG